MDDPTITSQRIPFHLPVYQTSRIYFIFQIADWFASLAECLHWNVRKKQRQFDEMSDMTRSSSNDTLDSYEKAESVET